MIRHDNRLAERTNGSPTKAGWRVNEWAADVGMSRAFVWNLIADGMIDTVKAGAARIIVTSPRDYLASLAGNAE